MWVFLGGFVAGGVFLYLISWILGWRSVPTELDQIKVLITKIREVVISQLLNNHPRLFAAIAKQKLILNDQRRQAIAIFISPKTFKELINSASVPLEQTGNMNTETLYEVMNDLHTPVGFLGELPIYISELLEDTPVFVVGRISWEL